MEVQLRDTKRFYEIKHLNKIKHLVDSYNDQGTIGINYITLIFIGAL